MEKAIPFINSSMMQQHKAQTVEIVGKVEKNTGHICMIRTSDQGSVEVMLNDSSRTVPEGHFASVVGKVDDEGERVREYLTVVLGENVDMNLLEQCIQLQPRFPQVFKGTA